MTSTMTRRYSCPAACSAIADELLYQGIANRAMQLPLGNAGCYGYLGVGTGGQCHHSVD